MISSMGPVGASRMVIVSGLMSVIYSQGLAGQGSGHAEGQQGGVVVEALTEAGEQAGQGGDQGLWARRGLGGGEGAQGDVAVQLTLRPDPGLGQAVGVEQQRVARAAAPVRAAVNCARGMTPMSMPTGGGEVVGVGRRRAWTSAGGWPPEARWTAQPSSRRGSRKPKTAVQ